MGQSTPDFDVIVLGGGPAGSTAALRTQNAGLKTLIIERDAFPRFRIGESLLPYGNHLLEELGVWEKIEDAGFPKKYGASFHLANGAADKEVIFTNSLVKLPSRTYQVDRAKFDQILIAHARESGVEVLQPGTVREVVQTAGSQPIQTIRVKTETGETTVTCRYVIDATGRDRNIAHPLKANPQPVLSTRRVAIYSHFSNVARRPGTAAGHTVIVRTSEGWFWLIPIDETRTSVGLVTTVETLRTSGREPGDFFNDAVAAAPKLRELMQGSTPLLRTHVTADYSYFHPELAGGRFVMAGDAAGFYDPIFSSGVYLATYSAKLAAELVIRAAARDRSFTPAECKSYTSGIRKHAGVFEKLIQAFYDNDRFSVFMCTQPPLGMGPAITSIVAGYTKWTWPVWWRFQAFLLVCRMQRRFALVPRIDFAGMSVANPPPSNA